MADIEKVIKGLDCCADARNVNEDCFDCTYFDRYLKGSCRRHLLLDALELLKEQEQIITSLKADLQETLKVVSEQSNVVRCKDCKLVTMFETADGQTLCECGVTTSFHKPDWFCADGEPTDT